MLSIANIATSQQQDGGDVGMDAPHHPAGTSSGPQPMGIPGSQQINVLNHDQSMQVENNVNVDVHATVYQQLNVEIQPDMGPLVNEAWTAINEARNESSLIGARAAHVLKQATDENHNLQAEADRLVMAAQAEAEVHLRSARVHSQVVEQARIGIDVAMQQARESELARQQATALAAAQSQQLQQLQTARAAQSSHDHEVIWDLQQQIGHLRSRPPSLTPSMGPPSSPSPIRIDQSEAREPQCSTGKSTVDAQVMTAVKQNVTPGDRRRGERGNKGGSAIRSLNRAATVNHTKASKAETAIRSASQPSKSMQRERVASPLRSRNVSLVLPGRVARTRQLIGTAGQRVSQATGKTTLSFLTTYCTFCGARLQATANFCGFCGGKVTRDLEGARGSGRAVECLQAPQFLTTKSTLPARSTFTIAPTLPRSLFQDIEGVAEIERARPYHIVHPDNDPDSSHSSDGDDGDDNGAGGGRGGPRRYGPNDDDEFLSCDGYQGEREGDHPMLDLWGQASPDPNPDDFEFQIADETTVYKSRELPPTGKLPDLPKDAAEYRGYTSAVIAIFVALDLSINDMLTKWLLVPFNVTGDARHTVTMLHQDSQGLIRLDRWLAKEMLISKNLLDKTFGGQFSTYMEWCTRHGVSPRGRVFLALIALRFRLDRSRGTLLNQMHLFKIQLTSFKHSDIKSFMDKIRLVLANVNVGELKDHDLLFRWLFEKFRAWKAIERKIETIKESREGSSKRTWNYLWAAIDTHLTNHNEDDNCRNLESALAGKTVNAAAATKGNKKEKKKEKAAAKAADEEKKLVDAAAAKAKGKGKSKSKGKGKDTGKGKGKGQKESGAGSTFQQVDLGFDHQQRIATAKALPHKARTLQQRKMLLCSRYRDGKCPHANGKDCDYSHNQALLQEYRRSQTKRDAATLKFDTAVTKAAAAFVQRANVGENYSSRQPKPQQAQSSQGDAKKTTSQTTRNVPGGVAVFLGLADD